MHIVYSSVITSNAITQPEWLAGTQVCI